MSFPDACARAARPPALLLGPQLDALSGVSMHLKLLLASQLASDFSLSHFQVGSEGRNEGVAARWLRLSVSPLRLAVAVLASGAKIVHLNTALTRRAYWRDLAYLLVARICGARVIYQVHGGALPQDFPGRNPLLAELLRATLYLPDAIVVLANAELRAFREFVPGQRVLALPNAVDCAAFGESAHRRPDPDATLRLVYIGRLAEEKGIFESLQGIKLALAQGVRAELVIAGGGPDEARLKQSADQLALGSQVSFVGPISGERKAALLARADASILASRAEGLPYALLESMAAGVPVIATRVGAIPDVVSDRVHGLLIARPDPRAIAQAILTLASDRALLERMGEACRIRIANGYAIERLAKDLSRLYAQVCDSNKRVHAART